MNENKHSRRDFIQNISIAVLTVSAVLLFVQSQVYNLGASSSFSRLFSGPDVQTSAVITPQQDESTLLAPVRIAVASTYGRYGDVAMTTGDEDFLFLRQLLEQALGSAQTMTISSSHAFLSALSGTSVYYDFLSPLPLSVLAELAQTSLKENQISARHLVVAEENGIVLLHLWDGGTHYYRSNTALSPNDLLEAVRRYELGNAFFAFENTDVSTAAVSSLSLFLEESPVLPELSGSSQITDRTLLLASLHFNPNTQNRYREADGTEVISENNNRTLRIGTDGTVLYHSDGDSTLSVEAAEAVPSLIEAATEVHALLNGLFPASAGENRFYLEQIRQTNETTLLSFGYQVGGVPVRFANGQSAALVELSGTAVSSITLNFRQYAVSENTSLLLPLRQALAVAADLPGAALSIGYVDRGGEAIRASWLAD